MFSKMKVLKLIAAATLGVGLGDATIAGGRLRSMCYSVAVQGVRTLRHTVMTEQMKFDEIRHAIALDQAKVVESRAKHIASGRTLDDLEARKGVCVLAVTKHTEHLKLLNMEPNSPGVYTTVALVLAEKGKAEAEVVQLDKRIASLVAARDRVEPILHSAQQDIDNRREKVKSEELRREFAKTENSTLNSALTALDGLPSLDDSSASLFAELCDDTDKLIAENTAKTELLARHGGTDGFSDQVPATLSFESLKRKQQPVASANQP